MIESAVVLALCLFGVMIVVLPLTMIMFPSLALLIGVTCGAALIVGLLVVILKGGFKND